MTERGYVYSLVRYVPNPTIGEFINVGVIAGSDRTGDWKVCWLKNLDRAARLARTHGRDTFDFLKYYMGQVQGFIEPTGRPNEAEFFGAPEEKVSEKWLQDMFATTNNVVQFTQPLPSSAKSALETIERISKKLLLESEVGASSSSRQRLVASVEGSLQRAIDATVADRGVSLRRDVTVRSNGFTNRSALAAFDDDRLQLTSVWSFNTAAAQHTRVLERVRSFLWFVEHARDEPLTLLDQRAHPLCEAPTACHIAVVVEPPATDERAVYDEAINSIDATTSVHRFAPDTIDALTAELTRIFA